MSVERDLTAEMISAIAGDVVYPFFAIYANLPTGEVNMWTGAYTLSWNSGFGSSSWVGVGEAITINIHSETTDSRIQNASVTVSGLGQVWFKPVMYQNYQKRPAKVWLGLMTVNRQIIPDPFMIFSGIMEDDELEDDGATSRLTIRATSDIADVLRPREWLYTHEDQKRLTGQSVTGMEYRAEIQDLQIKWGASS